MSDLESLTTTVHSATKPEKKLKAVSLELFPNIQFIYELALAMLELESFGIDYRFSNTLRKFIAHNDFDHGLVAKRTAYFGKIDNLISDYYYIQQKNRTRSVNQYLTHWIYPYKGKFHPQMIRSLLNIIRVKPGETILDPFIGSGTAALECQLLGVNCVGIDISPLCVLQSKVKTQSLYVLDEIQRLRPLIEPPMQGAPQRSLFSKEGIEQFEDHRVADFLLMAEMVALSDQSRRGKNFRSSFYTALDRMIASVQDFKYIQTKLNLDLGRIDVRKGDARALDLPGESIDGIITSPPYSIALNYVKNDLHALKALGYSLENVEGEFIGVRGRGARKFELYNQDMAKSIAEMYRVLKPGKTCVIVIGNVTQQGEEIDTTGMIISECQKVGFDLLKRMEKIIFGLYNIMQQEYILFFRKPERV